MPAATRTSYLRERLNKFGLSNYFPGSQEEYLASRNKGIRKARELINQGPTEDLFDRCFSICAETRRNYAIRLGDSDCTAFGVRRTSHFLAYCTALSDPRYSEYGEIIGRFLTSAATSHLTSKSLAALQSPHIIHESTFEGIVSTLEFRLIPEDAMSIIANSIERQTSGDERSTDQYGRPCFTEKYKTNNPDRYRDEAIQIAVNLLENKVPWKKPTPPRTVHSYLLATSRLELEPKESCEMSRYLLRLDSSEGKLTASPVIVIHQDSFLIQQTMKKIQSIFNEIVQAPREELKKKLVLRKRLGMMRYLFAQATPLDRGSADCAGALERTLTPAKDLPLLDRRDTCMEMDLEALTAVSLSAFMERYLAGWVAPTPPSYLP